MTHQPEPPSDQPSEPEPEPEPEPQVQPIEPDGPVGCTPSFADLFRYMDGVLDEGRVADLRSHLAKCGCCDEMYHFQTSFRQMIETRCQVDLPPDLPKRIFGAIGESGTGSGAERRPGSGPLG